jgi:hypothetical protein
MARDFVAIIASQDGRIVVRIQKELAEMGCAYSDPELLRRSPPFAVDKATNCCPAADSENDFSERTGRTISISRT